MEIAIRRYGLALLDRPILSPVRAVASVLCTANSPGVWDFMVVLPDKQFAKFAKAHGQSVVIDDHDAPHGQPVFARIVSRKWIREDFKRRLPIALWVYSNSLRVQDNGTWLDILISRASSAFERNRPRDLRSKYLALRQERHNLRYAVRARYTSSVALIKAAFYKLAVELVYIQERRPYPYRILLPVAAEVETEAGKALLPLLTDFLEATGPRIIELTDEIIVMLHNILDIPQHVKNEWWLHLE